MTHDTDALVRRVHEEADALHDNDDARAVLIEAADAIERLSAEVASAHANAIEEAARVADDYKRDGSLTKAYECETADELAARIRALAALKAPASDAEREDCANRLRAWRDRLDDRNIANQSVAYIMSAAALSESRLDLGRTIDDAAALLRQQSRVGVSEEDERDAALWRALLAGDRMRIMGWAGFDKDGKPRDDTYLHFGMEFWTEHDAKADPACAADTKRCRTILTGYADRLLDKLREKA